MMFVIVKQMDVVIAKEAYAGDTSALQGSLDQRALSNPDLTFEIFDDSKVKVFNAVPIVEAAPVVQQLIKAPLDQTNWQTAKGKGTDAALSFLAQRLGLE